MKVEQMSITTKVGDRQTTRLFSGEEISKDDLRLETYGTLDELVSQLGVARSLLSKSKRADEIRELQVDLFRIGGELACIDPKKHSWIEPTTEKHVTWIEARMKNIESQLKLPKSFLVPGAHPVSAHLDVARTIARRFERCAIALSKSGGYDNTQGLIYFNRLSDYCFLLARAVEMELGIIFDAKNMSDK